MNPTDCARCGNVNAPPAVFCVQCGTPLVAPGTARAAHTAAPHVSPGGQKLKHDFSPASHAGPGPKHAVASPPRGFQNTAHDFQNPAHVFQNSPHGVAPLAQTVAHYATVRVGAAGGALAVDFPAAPFEGIGDVLRPTYRLYRDNFLLVIKIVLAACVPLVAVQYVLLAVPGPADEFDVAARVGLFLLGGLVRVLFTSLMAGALTYSVIRLLGTGAAPGLAEAYGFSARRWLKIFSSTLLVAVLTGAGFMLFLVPGLFMLTVFAVVLPAVVVEGRGPVAALERSAELTRGYRLLTFFTTILLWIFVSVVTWATVAPGDASSFANESFVTTLVYTAAEQLLTSAFTVLSLFIYLGILADKYERAAPGYAAPVAGARH
jgi:hypothetical protein